ncbi:MAG: hypothetical protein G3M78_01830 [Candidatus Nitrohelix vancouverensis]|uniref:Uncharacterized protein n=1 Tax=Candidatus Nitrohelix vancouverensis TaxID=2705534 RepID=A0A7T0G2C8_9BACT|nr:MAG: hypothetical protein G3M78_01830 [Candidatus Nitrohelix vancouverensis]
MDAILLAGKQAESDFVNQNPQAKELEADTHLHVHKENNLLFHRRWKRLWYKIDGG